MVSVCLPSDDLSQCPPTYLGFSYLGHGVSLHGCSSKAQPLLLTLDVGCLLSAAQPPLLCWPFPSPGDLPNPGIERRSPTLQADSLPAEPQGKPKNTGVGSLSFLQGIFLTPELNQGLLHWRWILYHLNYQGSPDI